MSEIRPVALDIQAPNMGQQAQTNPLGMFNTLSEIQMRGLEMQRYRNTMAGQARFGEIMNGPGTPDEKLNAAASDPLVAAYAPDRLNVYKQTELAMLQGQEVAQRLGTSGFTLGMDGLRTVITNPATTQDQFHQSQLSRMSVLSPEAQKDNMFSMASTEHYLYDNLPPGEAGQAELRNRAVTLASGIMPPDQLRGLLGLPTPSTPMVRLSTGAELPAPVSVPLVGAPSMTVVGGGAGQVPPGPGQVTPSQVPGSPSALPPTATVAPPAGTNPYGQQLLPGETAVAPPRTPQPVQVGQTTQQLETTKSMVAADSKIRDEMAEFNPRSNVLGATRLDAMFEALKMVRTGGMVELGVQAGQKVEGLMRAIGVSRDVYQPVVDAISGGNQAAAQMLRHLVTNQAVATLKDSMQGTGRVMRPEVDKSLERLDLNMEPEALFHILNDQTMPLIQMDYDMETKWPQYETAANEGRMGAFGVRHFKSWEMGLSRKQRIQTTPDGINLGNRDISEMYSGPAYAPTPAPAPRTAPAPATAPRSGLPPIRLTPPGQ